MMTIFIKPLYIEVHLKNLLLKINLGFLKIIVLVKNICNPLNRKNFNKNISLINFQKIIKKASIMFWKINKSKLI